MPQVEVHNGSIKQQTVEQVEYAANAREKVAGILDTGFTFKDGLDEVADDGGDAENNPQDDGVEQVHGGHFTAEEMDEEDAGESGGEEGAAKAFPGFAGADAGNHFMATDEGADGISAGVTEFGDKNEVEQVVMAVDTREEVNFLDKVEEPGDVHEAKEGSGNGEDAGGVAAREELAEAKAQDKEDKEAGFEVVDTGGAAGGAEISGEVEESPDDEEQAAEDAPAAKTDELAFGDEAVKLGKPSDGKEDDDGEKNVVGDGPVAGEEGSEDNGPEDDETEETSQENLEFGGWCWRVYPAGFRHCGAKTSWQMGGVE